MPVVIDLLSSPEPEPKKIHNVKKRRVERESGSGSPTRRTSSNANEQANGSFVSKSTRDVSHSSRGKSAGFAEEDGSRNSPKEVEKEKEREMTEAEKVRELRMKRFGRPAAASPSASDLEQMVSEKEIVESTCPEFDSEASKGLYSDNRAGQGKYVDKPLAVSRLGVEANKSTSTAVDDSYGTFDITNSGEASGGSARMPRSAVIDDSYGTFVDMTQDSDDDLPAPGLLSKGKSVGKSAASKDAGQRYGMDDRRSKTVDHSDPFRSSSPVEISKDSRNHSYDRSYDTEAPLAKRRKVSPEPRTTSSLSGSKARATTKDDGGYRRTVSNSAAQSSRDPKAKAAGLKRSKTTNDDPDPLFTSSFDPFEHRRKTAEKRKTQGSDDGFVNIDDDDEPKQARTSAKNPDPILSDDDDMDDSDLELPSPSEIKNLKPKPKKTASQTKDTSTAALPSPARKPKSAKAALDAYEKGKIAEKKAQEKAEKEAQKVAAKEEAKEKKRLEKEEKAKEKERATAFSKVNTLKTDKKITTSEMIVDFSTGMDELLIAPTKVMLDALNVEQGTWDSPVPNVIKWRRNVQAEYDAEEDMWRPVPHKIKREDHYLVIMKGQEFVDLINGEEGKDLVCHILKMKGRFERVGVPPKNIIYMIEGLDTYLKNNRNAKSRKHIAEVRSGVLRERGELEAAEASNARKRKRKADEVKDINEDAVKDALLEMQVMHGLLIHHTAATAETAQWIVAFTEHLSTRPGRLQKQAQDANVCLDAGQIKSGQNAEDTFIKMLQQNNRLTAPVAFGIATEYNSVAKLMNAYEEAVGEKEAMDLLANLQKSSNQNGGFTRSRIGGALSKRLYKVFTGRDQDSTDI